MVSNDNISSSPEQERLGCICHVSIKRSIRLKSFRNSEPHRLCQCSVINSCRCWRSEVKVSVASEEDRTKEKIAAGAFVKFKKFSATAPQNTH